MQASKEDVRGRARRKADWFLEEALDTVYDPHGTGKAVKAATILARSSDGNVRVRDVVRAYALQGRDGISELAWTSPITEYLIEAFDAADSQEFRTQIENITNSNDKQYCNKQLHNALLEPWQYQIEHRGLLRQ